jgi:transcriptional regulator with XRE-family HTH domain
LFSYSLRHGIQFRAITRHIRAIGAVIGRYERNEITPSVEIANKIAKALDVSLDYLVGNNSVIVKDKKILKRVEAIANMPDDEQQQIFNVIDALLRDYNAKKTYA